MKNIAFSKTINQCRSRLKTVTRRWAWSDLKPGTILQQVEKGQGIPRGGKVKKIYPIQVINNRAEPLNRIMLETEYGAKEMILEGFPGMQPCDFVSMLCEGDKHKPQDIIHRIDFRYFIADSADMTLIVPPSVAVCASCKKKLTISPDSWYLDEDGTMICDSFSRWCEEEPDMEDEEAYAAFKDSHAAENYMPYIYWLPVDNKIERWLKATFRFEVG